MKRKIVHLLTLFAALVALTAGGTAQAAITYQYVFGQGSYLANPGQSVSVNVYLQETVTTPSVGVLDPTASGIIGMFSGGVAVHVNEGPVASDPADVSSIITNPAFSDIGTAVYIGPPPGLTVVNFTGVNGSATITPGVYRMLLGTYNFTAGLIPGEVTSLRATDRSALDDNITMTGIPLDAIIADGNSNITVVPEPSSVILAAGALGVVVLTGWRKRRNAKSV